MWTSQVYGHHDKMARTKTHRTTQNTEYTKTQQTLRNNYIFVYLKVIFTVLAMFHIFHIFIKIMPNNNCERKKKRKILAFWTNNNQGFATVRRVCRDVSASVWLCSHYKI